MKYIRLSNHEMIPSTVYEVKKNGLVNRFQSASDWWDVHEYDKIILGSTNTPSSKAYNSTDEIKGFSNFPTIGEHPVISWKEGIIIDKRKIVSIEDKMPEN
ncbi:MAG: hypothetical protein PVJ67_03015 [Candidatus Pacearchaeota archaeon]|jgi:hypothetical protein